MAAKRYIVKWTNKYSGETGFVAKVCKDHFENTYDADGARKFTSAKQAEKAVTSFSEMGEAENNSFETILV